MMKILISYMLLFSGIALGQSGDFQCVGGKEACAKAAELNRLQVLSGESCAGSYENCRQYLNERLHRPRILDCWQNKKGEPNCWLRISDADIRLINPNNPPMGWGCEVSADAKRAICRFL